MSAWPTINTLSGGEAQRIKLASFLCKVNLNKSFLFLMNPLLDYIFTTLKLVKALRFGKWDTM